MKRQTRPFVVEVKQKRGSARQGRSIWGDLNLAAIAAEATKEAEAIEHPNRQLIDSDGAPSNAEVGTKPRAEYLMADPQETESEQTTTEAPAKAEVKKRIPRTKKTKTEPKRSVAKNVAKAAVSEAVAPVPAKAPRKTYSAKERTQKLGQIEKSIAGGESIKSATKQAGISEQTYYQWKKSAAPASDSGELKDLIALEEENTRLKKLLAERLRKENAELKKKLGL
ncbi:transposase [Mesorhizobium sp. A623]